MKPVKAADLKRYLLSRSQTELTTEILELCKLFPAVKEYYAAKIDPDFEQELMVKYKKIIGDEFFPIRGFGKLRFSVANKALSDFEKVAKFPGNIAELKITYAELGVQFTNTYGDINEAFYNKILVMYEKAADYVVRENLEDVFRMRLENVMDEGQDIGWGFSDGLAEIYYSYFADDEEDT